MLFLFFFVGIAFAQRCDPGWSYFNGNCYKHIMNWNNMVTHEQAQAQCAARNAYMTGVESVEESDFLSKLGSRKGDWELNLDAMTAYSAQANLATTPVYGDGIMVMGTRDSKNNWKWPRSNSNYFNWCPPTEPSNYPEESCLIFTLKPGSGASCLWDTPCTKTAKWNNVFPRYICKKAAGCETGAERQSNGNCRCKKDYFDITDTDCPEKRDYKKGEMCIPRVPCQNVTSKDSLAIVFVVDSSQSIGASNWKNMVNFLKSGSRQLDNSISVGFVQFSTTVTYSGWLPRRWTKDDYLDQTPSSFDAGYTNTPAALDEAGKLFASDRSTHQVAVLITDGMPYVEDILPKEDAMPKTTEAANKLRKAGIDLVALGYGSELVKYQSYLKQILAKPRSDYFEYDKEAGDLKDIHMTILLNKVCGRFQ